MLLPDDVQERILNLLPTVDLLRGQAVCKQWLSLTSQLLASRPPWILLRSKFSAKQVEYSLAYDLAAFGLGSKSSFSIGDPWTGTWKDIEVGFPFTRLRGFYYSEEGWSFIVVASHGVRLSEVTTVLRRAENDVTRRTSTYIPQHFMVERDGKLYSWTGPHGLMVYDVGKGVCAHVGGTRSPLLEDRKKTLLKCGQRLVRVYTYYEHDVVGCKMRCKVEKLCDENPLQEPIKVEEMGVMPAHLYDELVDGEWRIGLEFFAGGINHVCFRSQKSFKILTFDLLHRTWNWLPDCPFLASAFNKSQCRALKGFSLRVWPRLFFTVSQNLSAIADGYQM
ncbi:hypothetical protein L7F22_042630 [Adiantum nelumboides]|nr:hypothetical protein [Adiantum nelumboides]